MRQIYFLIIALALMIPAQSRAQTAVVDDSSERFALGAASAFIEDPAGALGIEDVRGRLADEFSPARSSPLYFGLTRSAYWVRFSLRWDTSAAGETWILEVGPPKHVEGIARGGTRLFVYDDQGNQILDTRLGSLESEQELATLQGGFAVRLDPATAAEVFLRVESARELRLPLTLWKESTFRAQELGANTGFGIRYGILIAMVFYNLFLYISIRERSFLFYVVAIAAQLAFLFLDSKHARLVLDAGPVSNWLINMAERNIYILMAMAHLHFQRHLLQVWTYNPALDRIFKILLALFAFSLLVSLVPDEKIVQSLYLPLIIFGLGLVLYTNVDAIRRGIATAKLHLIAIGALIAGAGIQLLHQVFGLLPNFWLTDQALELGMLAQALLLSFTLAFRYNAMKKEKEDAQRQAISHLVHSEKVKDQLLANVSHELRTPVHGINGLAEIALRDLNQADMDLDGARKNLQLISSSGNRLIRLIDDLLDVSSLRNKGTSINLSAVDLHQLVETVIATTRVLTSNRPIKLHNLLGEQFPPVLADRDRLQQILINLVSNAIKFTPEGDVWIAAAVTDPGSVTVSVKDNGIGIPAEEQHRIFQPFEKGSAPAAMQSGGAGLGLTISAQLAELHGSKLEVLSCPGTGSVFSFRLPLAQRGDAQHENVTANSHIIRRSDFSSVPAQAPAAATSSEALILIVDDDAINRRVMSEQLKQYQVVQAADGIEALALISRQKPDLVLLDLMMPGPDGYEVCREIRQVYDQSQLPVIIVTAKNHLEDLTQGFLAGASDYLSKPFHMEELRARVESHLKLSRLQRVSAENMQLRLQIDSYVQASRELSAAEQHLEKVLDRLRTGAITLKSSGRIAHINPAAAGLLSIEQSQLQDEQLKELLSDSPDGKKLLELITRWSGGEPVAPADEKWQVEFTVRNQRLPLEVTASVEEDAIILFLTGSQAPAPTRSHDERELTIILNEAQRDVRSLNTRLKLLTPDELNNHPEILKQFGSMHRIVEFLDEHLPRDGDHFNYREQLVTLMQLTLETWEQATGKTKIDLAEGSKLWAVSIDDGRLRTRTFDRYLRVDLLPKVPRWREVVRTAYFVLSNPSITPEQRQKLEKELQKTKAALQQSALM